MAKEGKEAIGVLNLYLDKLHIYARTPPLSPTALRGIVLHEVDKKSVARAIEVLDTVCKDESRRNPRSPQLFCFTVIF